MVDTVLTGEPYSKERQLARGARRYRRKVASPKQWTDSERAYVVGKLGEDGLSRLFGATR